MKINSPAGFLLRLLAALNEQFIFLLIFALILLRISQNTTLVSLYQGFIILLLIIIFYSLAVIFYNVYFTYYFGGTLGKLITGLRVKTSSGERLPFKMVLFRQLISYLFSSMIFGLGFFSIIKDPDKQGWHDKTVDSNVFKVQSLAPVALIVFLLAFGTTIYLFKTTFDNFAGNPALGEIANLVNRSEASQSAVPKL